jgi:hypothetical protein
MSTAEETFAVAIERIRQETKLGYLDAIVLWAERNACELETAAAMVKKDSVLKGKLMMESQQLHMLKIKSANTLF